MEVLDIIRQFLITYGMPAIFLVGFLEEIIFVIPSSTTFLAAGFFLVDPTLPLGLIVLSTVFKIAFWGSLGVTIGSFLIYGIFYWGGKAAIDKYGRYLGISWEGINRLEQKFAKGRVDEIVFVLLRASPIWSMTLISAFAGLIRWPWKKFGIYTFFGTVVRVFILGLLGWKFGVAFDYLGDRFENIELYGTIILAVFFFAMLVYVFKNCQKIGRNPDEI